MFQSQEKQTNKLIVIIGSIIAIIVIAVFMISSLHYIETDPYIVACVQIKEYFAGLSSSDCMIIYVIIRVQLGRM